MDPALWEMLEEGGDEEEVAVLMRLRGGAEPPAGVRVVARIGDIASCRLRRAGIEAVRSEPDVLSLKAPRPVTEEPISREDDGRSAEEAGWEARHPDVRETGRGVVIGVIDWGCDFTHPNFRTSQGRTRLRALWDQRARFVPGNNSFERGHVFSRQDIDRALAAPDPFESLGYRPTSPDGEEGAHGTHVLDIAAGSGRVGPGGVAPEADIVFVHLSGASDELGNFGDSVGVLEAVHFVFSMAGDRPCVVNLSMGRHAGPHDGTTLVEQALDAALRERPGCAIVNSAGNYFDALVHAAGEVRPGARRQLEWRIAPGDSTTNELEVWYRGLDEFELWVHAPDDSSVGPVRLGDRRNIELGGRTVGRAYHRASDPNNGDHHMDLFLFPEAPPGVWRVELRGARIVDGRFHAWIERDSSAGAEQSRFARADADPRSTTGTIANGLSTIAVGAYDPGDPQRPPARFSSEGPTRDGRQKPDLVAPGVRQVAARSSTWNRESQLVAKSGTSMAAPHVTGTIALMLEARPDLDVHEVRALLLGSAEPGDPEFGSRLGSGYLDSAAAVRAARDYRRGRGDARPVLDVSESDDEARSTMRREATESKEAMLAEDAREPVELQERVPPPRTRVPLERVQYLCFEGGGGKGFAFLGALQALESAALGHKLRFERGRIAGDIRGIAGASAGALTAVAVASGVDAAELRSMIRPGERRYFDFDRFFDLPSIPRRVPRPGGCVQDRDEGRFLALLQRYFRTVPHGEVLLSTILRALFAPPGAASAGSDLRSKLRDHGAHYVRDLYLDFGLFSGCAARTFFDDLVARKAAEVAGGPPERYANLSFAMHREIFGAKLVLSGTNLETGRSELFSADTTPRFPVADAARISMSLPLFFKPMVIRDVANVGNGADPPSPRIPDEQLLGTWVDGGLLNNHPITAFDLEPGSNPKTFGVRLDEDAGRRPIRSLPEFAWRCIAMGFKSSDAHQAASNALYGRSVQLDARGLSLIDFSPSIGALERASEAARRETLRYFGRA